MAASYLCLANGVRFFLFYQSILQLELDVEVDFQLELYVSLTTSCEISQSERTNQMKCQLPGASRFSGSI